MVASAWHCMVMVHRIKVNCLKHTIWRFYGNCPAFSYAKITIMVCADADDNHDPFKRLCFSICFVVCPYFFLVFYSLPPGMGTSAERSSSNTSYYTRGDVLPGIWIDGMDVLAVRNGFEFAIKHAVETGPVVIEVNTYRLVFHSRNDDFSCTYWVEIVFCLCFMQLFGS